MFKYRSRGQSRLQLGDPLSNGLVLAVTARALGNYYEEFTGRLGTLTNKRLITGQCRMGPAGIGIASSNTFTLPRAIANDAMTVSLLLGGTVNTGSELLSLKHQSGFTPPKFFVVVKEASTGKMQYITSSHDDGESPIITQGLLSTSVITNGTLNHIVVTRTGIGASDNVYMYVNGLLENSAVIDPLAFGGVAAGVSLHSVTFPGATGNIPTLYDLRQWNRYFAPNEVSTLYSSMWRQYTRPIRHVIGARAGSTPLWLSIVNARRATR